MRRAACNRASSHERGVLGGGSLTGPDALAELGPAVTGAPEVVLALVCADGVVAFAPGGGDAGASSG